MNLYRFLTKKITTHMVQAFLFLNEWEYGTPNWPMCYSHYGWSKDEVSLEIQQMDHGPKFRGNLWLREIAEV